LDYDSLRMANGDRGPLALLLTGGGARGAYQVGVLRGLAALRPDLEIPILTGVSAGGINVACLAASRSGLRGGIDTLNELWCSISPDDVFRADPWSLFRGALRWVARLGSGGAPIVPKTRGLVDTSPLWGLLRRVLDADINDEIPCIEENLDSGRLHAAGLATIDWSSGRTIFWVQGRGIDAWRRPQRSGVQTRLSVDHVMASAALPLLFPAVKLAGSWHGDGGVRLTTPLAPAIHLGARRLLAVSTRYDRYAIEPPTPQISGYPPPAQIGGILLHSIFLDQLDHDAYQLERTNRLLRHVDPAHHENLRPLDLLVLRPSVDLGKLAAEYEARMPRGIRFLTRGLGTRETRDADFLSLLMFQEDYVRRVIAIGEEDAHRQRDAVLALVE
jgi:NTE family protein